MITLERFNQLTKALKDQGLLFTESKSERIMHITIKGKNILVSTDSKIIAIYQDYGPVTMSLEGVENGLAYLNVKGFGSFKAALTLGCATIDMYVRDDWI